VSITKLIYFIRSQGLKGEVARGSLGSIAIKIGASFLALVVSVLLVRFLGAEGYGVYAYVYAIICLVSIPTTAGLPTLIVREVAVYYSKEQWSLMLGILRFSDFVVFLVSLSVLLLAVLFLYINQNILSADEIETAIWGLLLLPIMTLGMLRGASLQGLRKVIYGQLLDVTKPLLLACFLGALYLINEPLDLHPSTAMGLHLVAAIVVFIIEVILLIKFIPNQTHHVKREYEVRKWIKSILPLSAVGAMLAVNQQADIVMIGYFLNVEDIAVYKVTVQASLLVIFVAQALNVVAAPHISKLYLTEQWENLQRLVSVGTSAIFIASLPIAAGLIFFGDTILEFVFGTEFASGHVTLVILCVGQLINASMGFVGLLLNMAGYEKDVMNAMVLSVVMNITLNFFLIPLFGVEGAAVASTLSLAVWNLILLRQAYKRTGVLCVGFIGIKNGE